MIEWKILNYFDILQSYEISNEGSVKFLGTDVVIRNVYESSNGYNFVRLLTRTADYSATLRYFPIDDLVAHTFVPIPDELIGKPVKVEHIDGNLRNNHYENLRWVEDIEEWRDVNGSQNYQVSNWGNIRNKETLKLLSGHIYTYRCVVMKDCAEHLVHRIVADAFVKKVDGKSDVNHINEIKTDNYFKNLEYVDVVDNLKFGNHDSNVSNSMGSRVICIETGMVFRSTKEAAAYMNIPASSIIECCGGSMKHTHSYTFKWLDKDIAVSEKKKYATRMFGKKVKCIELDIIYDSIGIAARELKLNRRHIAECCNGKRNRTGGYHFEFV